MNLSTTEFDCTLRGSGICGNAQDAVEFYGYDSAFRCTKWAERSMVIAHTFIDPMNFSLLVKWGLTDGGTLLYSVLNFDLNCTIASTHGSISQMVFGNRSPNGYVLRWNSIQINATFGFRLAFLGRPIVETVDLCMWVMLRGVISASIVCCCKRKSSEDAEAPSARHQSHLRFGTLAFPNSNRIRRALGVRHRRIFSFNLECMMEICTRISIWMYGNLRNCVQHVKQKVLDVPHPPAYSCKQDDNLR